MPRSRPVKWLSEGDMAELQLVDLLNRSWIQHSTVLHAASVVFALKLDSDGIWRICYDYRGLNTISRQAIEPLPLIDALLDAR